MEVAGRTVLERSLEGVFGMSEAAQVVVVAPDAWISQARAIGSTVAAGAGEYLTLLRAGRPVNSPSPLASPRLAPTSPPCSCTIPREPSPRPPSSTR